MKSVKPRHRLLAALALGVLVSLLTASLALAVETPTGVITAGRLNVRSGPSVGFAILGTVSKGEVVDLLGRNPNTSWVMIATEDGLEGWVSSFYVESAVRLATLPMLDATIEPYAVVGTGAANVRSGPGIDFEVIDVLPALKAVAMIGRNFSGTWVEVRYDDDMTGWVGASVLINTAPIQSLPLTWFEDLPVTGPPATLPDGEPQAVIVAGRLNVRSGPGIEHGIVTVISQGDVVTLLGRNAATSWVFVELEDLSTGWVSSAFIWTEYDLARLPVED